MAETKWRTVGVGVAPSGYEWRNLCAGPEGEWKRGSFAGLLITEADLTEREYRAPVLDEAAEPAQQPVVVAAFIAPTDSRWQGMAINVTSDGAWWIIGNDGAWMRTAPPIAAKGGE